MNPIDVILGVPLGWLFCLCYKLLADFGWAIILFTLLTKVILFPLSFISQKNAVIMVKIKPQLDDIQARYEGEFETMLKEQKALYKKEHYSTLKAVLPLLAQIPVILGVISVMYHPERHLPPGYSAMSLGLDLAALPPNLLIAVLSGLSAFLLCLVQNYLNPLTRESGFLNKWGVAGFLTVFSGYFAAVCPAGVGVYWIAGNVAAILVTFLCNAMYNPKKYIDYENRSVKPKMTREEKLAKKEQRQAEKLREKADMKRFFAEENHKELVFYSEASGFYKYFQHFIEYILEHSDITVHYLTSDLGDQVFNIQRERFETYFCSSRGLITAFMKMDCEILVMTMPDLETYHIKRSLVKKDIEYIYADHGEGSFHLMLRKGALDHFDTIFCYSRNHNEEVRATERVYQLPEKKLVDVGFGLFDVLAENYQNMPELQKSRPQILIAPSWQKDNLLEYCLDGILEPLLCGAYHVILRPHPEFVKRFPGKLKQIADRYNSTPGGNFELQTDFSSNETVYQSDLVITDWSSIAQEFSFTTKKPSLFINTPMKVMNPEWRKIEIVPQEIWIREKIGMSLDTDKLGDIQSVVDALLADPDRYSQEISDLVDGLMYNVGHTDAAGGEYLISQIQMKREQLE